MVKTLDYGITCNTPIKKLELLCELERVYITFHNDSMFVMDKGKLRPKNWREAKILFDSKFAGKFREIHRLRNEIIEQENLWVKDNVAGGFTKSKPSLTDTWKPSLSKLDYIGDKIAAEPFDPLENPNSYAEVDTGGFIAPASSVRATFTDAPRNTDFYMTKDQGVAAINGDFENFIDVQITSANPDGGTGVIHCATLANVIADAQVIEVANGDYLSILLLGNGLDAIILRELSGGAIFQDIWTGLTLGITNNLTFQRVEADGTFGTVYLIIRVGVVILATLSVALHSKKDFRYNYFIQSNNNGTDDELTGFVENYDLQLPITAALPPHMFQRAL